MNLLSIAIFGALQPLLAPAQTVSSTIHENVPLDFTIFIPCAVEGAGELVSLSGSLRNVVHTTINQNVLHVRVSSHPQGVSGTGLTSGDNYRGTGGTHNEINQALGGSEHFNFTLVNNFRVIGQGPGNNFQVHETFHLTINANGEVTSTVAHSSFSCK